MILTYRGLLEVGGNGMPTLLNDPALRALAQTWAQNNDLYTEVKQPAGQLDQHGFRCLDIQISIGHVQRLLEKLICSKLKHTCVHVGLCRSISAGI
jgi:hypothetical protein